MISAEDAIRVGRSLLDTPYSELDCINFLKKVIRSAPGGNKKYTTAGTSTLWASIDASAKYRDIVWRKVGINNAMPGMITFKGLPLGHDGEPHHVGLVTDRGTVIHSSFVYHKVVETPLTTKEGWTLLARHKLISVEEKEMKETYMARVIASSLNMRKKKDVKSERIMVLQNGEDVEVLEDDGEWLYVACAGKKGYCKSEFLKPVEDEDEPSSDETTTLIDEEGNMITLLHKWRIAED